MTPARRWLLAIGLGLTCGSVTAGLVLPLLTPERTVEVQYVTVPEKSLATDIQP